MARSIGRAEQTRSRKKKRVRPYGRWLTTTPTYDPETETTREFLVSTADYVKRFHARESFQVRDARGQFTGEHVEPECDAVLMTPILANRRLVRLKPFRVTSMGELRQYFDSPAGRAKRALEASGDAFATDADVLRSGSNISSRLFDTEIIPFMHGPYYKQLYQYDYLAMHARAFDLVNHSPLAAAAVKIMTRFVVGRGISFHVKDEQCQAVWDEFWGRNNMREKTRQMARDLTWQGELLLRYYEREPGYLTLRVLDASSCWEIVTDPEDIEHVYYYHFQYPTPYQLWVSGQIPISKYVVQQVPPTNLQHVKINVSSQEKRGRSDLLPALPWLKRFVDYYNGLVIKKVLEANLVWKIKVAGDLADLDRVLADPNLTTLPPPGGVWLENDALNLQPVTAQLTAGRDTSGIGQQIASIIATTLNLPAEYFNIESGGPSRATALVRTDPAVKSIEDRQQLLREVLETMYDRVIATALASGRLDISRARREPERLTYDTTRNPATTGNGGPEREPMSIR